TVCFFGFSVKSTSPETGSIVRIASQQVQCTVRGVFFLSIMDKYRRLLLGNVGSAFLRLQQRASHFLHCLPLLAVRILRKVAIELIHEVVVTLFLKVNIREHQPCLEHFRRQLESLLESSLRAVEL